MWKWSMMNEAVKKQQAAQTKFKKEINKILSHPETVDINLSDYPNVLSYINERFPNIDISSVVAKLINPEATKETSLDGAGGFYVESMNLIVVKSVIGQHETKSEYEKLLRTHYGSPDVEDVLLHELIHAVSSKAQRSSKLHTHMEEEFVYTNCMDFYKRKGMTDKDIIFNNFFPFLVNDVLANKKEVARILKGIIDLEEFSVNSKTEQEAIFDKNANVIVERLVKRASEKGWEMINCYNKFGCKIIVSSQLSASQSRFKAIDFDSDDI